MIASLCGELAAVAEGLIIVEVNGVGYQVYVSRLAQARLGRPGERVRLLVHTEVSQDSIRLFGFLEQHEKEVFETLITMSGLGPKTALQMLSGLEARELARAICRGDIARLCTLPGVGRKTAEKMVVHLKEKMEPFAQQAADGGNLIQDLRSALENLGFRGSEAEKAVAALRERALSGEGLEQLLPEALRILRG
jgi:Holliday junction DNA helicase RuvA